MDDCLMLSLLSVLVCCYIVDAQEIVIISKNPVKVKAGESTSINCEVTNGAANEDPQLVWLDKLGNPVANFGRIHTSRPEGSETELSLVLLNIVEDDAGTYICQGIINGQSTTKEVSLETYQGITMIECPNLWQPAAGSTATILCIVKGGSVGFRTYWTLENNQQIESGYKGRFTTETDKLIIRNVSVEDSGLYKLNAQLRGLDFKVFNVTIDVSIPPQIRTPPVLTTAVANAGFNMSCKAEGKPPPKYLWYKDEITNPLGKPRYIVDKDHGTLKIETVTLDDEGTYICIATNAGGTAEARAELDVLVPAKIVKLENITRDEGGNAKLVCTATGDPAPSMIWQQLGTDNPYAVGLQTDNSDITVTSNSDQHNRRTDLVLNIRNLKPQDDANYTCKAQNNAGSDNKTGRVTVRFKPNFDNQPYRETFGWHGNRNITCIANGMPEPVITWRKKESTAELTSETSFYKVENIVGVKQITSHLSISVDFSNIDAVFTDYVCLAHNVLGRRNITINFRQAVVPGQPGVTIERHTPRTIEFLVSEPSAVAGPPVEKYNVNYYIKGQSDEIKKLVVPKDTRPGARTKIILDELQPQAEYIISISAENPVGKGEPRRIQHQTEAVREPYRVEIKSPKVGLGVTTYRVQWVKPNDGGSTILSYTINYQEVSIKYNLTWEGDYIRDETLQGTRRIPKISSGKTVFEITNLEPNRYYEVEVLAINNQGPSLPLPFIFKTQKPSRPATVSEDTERLPTWAVVVIVIVIFFILFIIVDVTCYFKNKCGVLMSIMERLGSGSTGDGKDKSAAMEEGESKGLLSKEEDQEKEAKKEEDVVVEEEKEKEPEDKEEVKADFPEEVEKAEEAQPDETEKQEDMTEDLIEKKSEKAKETPTDSGDTA